MSSSNYEYFLNSGFLRQTLIESKGKVQRGFTKTGRKQMRQTFVNTQVGEKWAKEVTMCFERAREHINPDGSIGMTNLEKLDPTIFANRSIFYIDDDNYVPVNCKKSKNVV